MKTDYPDSFHQFTDEEIKLLASGDSVAINKVCCSLMARFDSLARYLAKKHRGVFVHQDVEDLMQDFWEKRFKRLCRLCRAEKMSAEKFNGFFYRSLYFTVQDYLRKKATDIIITGTVDAPVDPNNPDGPTRGDNLPAKPPRHVEDSLTCLHPIDQELFLACIHKFLVQWTKGNDLKIWAVKETVLYGTEPRFVVEEAMRKFPGTPIDAATVSQWKARFYERPEVRKIYCLFFDRPEPRNNHNSNR